MHNSPFDPIIQKPLEIYPTETLPQSIHKDVHWSMFLSVEMKASWEGNFVIHSCIANANN